MLRSMRLAGAVGQSPIGSTNWLWIEMDVSVPDYQGVPPEVAAVMQDKVDVHVWAFSTGVGSNVIQVMCGLPNLKDTIPADREAALATARMDCAGILRRMSFTAR